MGVRFPLYLGQVLVIYAIISQNPKLEEGKIIYSEFWLDYFLAIINFICIAGSIFMLGASIYLGSFLSSLWNKWNYLEVTFITCSTIILYH